MIENNNTCHIQVMEPGASRCLKRNKPQLHPGKEHLPSMDEGWPLFLVSSLQSDWFCSCCFDSLPRLNCEERTSADQDS
eukprot:1148925-Pelagomonas_calceolata.AAC.1